MYGMDLELLEGLSEGHSLLKSCCPNGENSYLC